MYDTIIIGSGTAGLSSAETLETLGLSCLLITKEANLKTNHLKRIELASNNTVISLEQNITSFKITDKAGKEYFSKAVIICSGKTKKPLGIKDEQFIHPIDLEDLAKLKENQVLCVVGTSKKTLLFAHLLFKHNHRVYISCPESDFLDHSPFKTKLQNNPEITFFMQSIILKVSKKEMVIQKSSGLEEVIKVDKIFAEFDYTFNTDFEILTLKNSLGEIKADKNQATNVQGLFTAGDVCEGFLKNELIIKAEGAKAALSAFEYLNSK